MRLAWEVFAFACLAFPFSSCRSLLLVSRLSCLVSSSLFSCELSELIGGESDLVPARDARTSTFWRLRSWSFKNPEGLRTNPARIHKVRELQEVSAFSSRSRLTGDQSVRRDEASTSVMQIAIRAQGGVDLTGGRKWGQTAWGVVYRDGKMLPPPADFR